MSIRLSNNSGNDLLLTNTSWSYVINLGELYGWRPAGARYPLNYACSQEWSECYDAPEQQIIYQSDASNLAKSLRMAVLNDNFQNISDELKENIQLTVEKAIGSDPGCTSLCDIDMKYITELASFLESGDITIS